MMGIFSSVCKLHQPIKGKKVFYKDNPPVRWHLGLEEVKYVHLLNTFLISFYKDIPYSGYLPNCSYREAKKGLSIFSTSMI